MILIDALIGIQLPVYQLCDLEDSFDAGIYFNLFNRFMFYILDLKFGVGMFYNLIVIFVRLKI